MKFGAKACLRQIAFILLLLPLFTHPCFAGTLYDRSLAQFNAKAQQADPGDYTFVVLGDSRDDDVVFSKALKLARSFTPLFILHGGDYSQSGGEAETAHFLSLVNTTVPQIPLFVVMGNHEEGGVFVRKVGPRDFTVESKRLGLTVVAVDNSEEALRPGELHYLRDHLQSGHRTRFVAMHVPPITDRWRWHIFTDGADELKRIIKEDQPQGVFFSHVHLFDRSEIGGVPAFITGGAGAPLVTFGAPGDPVRHILVVRVKNGKVSYRKVVIP